jgi:hypothetical protein
VEAVEVWKWNRKREYAAELLAESLLSYKEICAKVKCSTVALRNWRNTEEFKKRVDDLAAELRLEIRNKGIAILENRVMSYNDRWQRMQRVITERAADKQFQGVPGGETGLLCHKVKSIGSGEFATMVDEYEVDTGLLKEMREHEEQAAKELGQWQDKGDLKDDGRMIVIQFANLPAPPWADMAQK